MSHRQRLDNRRLCENFAFQCAGMDFVASVGRFPNGNLAELFISNHKCGSDADTAAKDSAVVCSIALQFGVPVETVRRALMRDSRGQPNGPLGVALDLLMADDEATR